MHHVAIMKPSWKLIPKILSGEKTIESRWYQTRRAPWNGIQTGDTVYFKDSGKPVSARARVSRVIQLEINTLGDAQAIVKKYGKGICIVNKDPATWGTLPKYCILIYIESPKVLRKPFDIDKRGFGSAAAWLSVKNIADMRK